MPTIYLKRPQHYYTFVDSEFKLKDLNIRKEIIDYQLIGYDDSSDDEKKEVDLFLEQLKEKDDDYILQSMSVFEVKSTGNIGDSFSSACLKTFNDRNFYLEITHTIVQLLNIWELDFFILSKTIFTESSEDYDCILLDWMAKEEIANRLILKTFNNE